MFAIVKKSSGYDLTVIIVTYNHKERIKRCLDSVLNQRTNYRYKVIIADDFSTDGTSEICAEYAEKFQNVKHIRQSKNVGVLDNVYPVFCDIDTEFWTALDGDDYWCDEEKIQLCIDALKQHPDCIGVTHQAEVETGYEKILYTKESEKEKIDNNIICFAKNYVNFPNTPTSSRLYRNIVDFSKMPKKAVWDIWLWTIFLSKGDFFYIDRVMSRYDVSPHQSIYHYIAEYGKYEEKRFLQKKDRLNFAQLSKYLGWKYDDQIREKVGLKIKHKNNIKNWIEYINKINPFDRRGLKFKVIEVTASMFRLKLDKNELRTQTFNKVGGGIVNIVSLLLGFKKVFKIKKRKNILAIYGSGGHGRDVFDLARAVNTKTKRWDDFVFINDFSDGKQVRGKNVVTFDDFKARFSTDTAEVVIAVGEPAIREILWNKVAQAGYSFATVIHPTVDLPETVKIGKGVTIGKNAFISCNVQIGDNTCIQVMACVGHDTVVGKNAVLSSLSNCGGNCKIGDNVYIALNVPIKEHTSIGDNTIVGMGAVVLKDLPSDIIAMGNPARPMLKNEQKRVFR